MRSGEFVFLKRYTLRGSWGSGVGVVMELKIKIMILCGWMTFKKKISVTRIEIQPILYTVLEHSISHIHSNTYLFSSVWQNMQIHCSESSITPAHPHDLHADVSILIQPWTGTHKFTRSLSQTSSRIQYTRFEFSPAPLPFTHTQTLQDWSGCCLQVTSMSTSSVIQSPALNSAGKSIRSYRASAAQVQQEERLTHIENRIE